MQIYILILSCHVIIIQTYQSMKSYEQKLKELKNRPEPLLIQVVIKQIEYQLQVYGDSTIANIIKRYSQRGYFDKNQVVTAIQVIEMEPNPIVKSRYPAYQQTSIRSKLKKQEYQSTTVQSLLAKSKSKRIRLQIVSQCQQTKTIKPQVSISSVRQENIDKSVQPSARQKVKKGTQMQITARQLENIIGQIQFSKCEEKYKQFERILFDKLINKLRKAEKNEADNETQSPNLQGSKKLKQLTQKLNMQKKKNKQNEQDYQNFISKVKQKISELNQKIRNNEQVQSNANSNVKGSMVKSKQKWGKNQLQIFKSIQKIYPQLKKRIEVSQSETKLISHLISQLAAIKQNCAKNNYADICILTYKSEDNLQQQKNSQNSQLIQMVRQTINLYALKIKQLEKQISDAKIQFEKQKSQISIKLSQVSSYISQSKIQVKSCFINAKQYQKQMEVISETIQSYEKSQISEFQSFLSLRKGQIVYDNIMLYLQSLKLNQCSKVLVIIGTTDGNVLVIYSTKGFWQESKKKIEIQETCTQQKGFIIQPRKKQVFRSTKQGESPSLITYNKLSMQIGGIIKIQTNNTNKRLQIQLKLGKKNEQLQDKNNQLEHILGASKKSFISNFQIFGVNLKTPGHVTQVQDSVFKYKGGIEETWDVSQYINISSMKN